MTGLNNVALGQHWLRLTHREREILLWVGGGMSNKEIAQQLGLSVGTVKIHTHRIFQKTGARSRYELVAQMATRSKTAVSLVRAAPMEMKQADEDQEQKDVP